MLESVLSRLANLETNNAELWAGNAELREGNAELREDNAKLKSDLEVTNTTLRTTMQAVIGVSNGDPLLVLRFLLMCSTRTSAKYLAT